MIKSFTDICDDLEYSSEHYAVKYKVVYCAMTDSDGTVWVDEVDVHPVEIQLWDRAHPDSVKSGSAFYETLRYELARHLGDVELADRCREHFRKTGGEGDEDFD